jgi:hypothetical protein
MTTSEDSAKPVSGVPQPLIDLWNGVAQLIASQPEFSPVRRWVAYFNTSRDGLIQGLPSFDAAREAIGATPLFTERYGQNNTERLTLEIMYNVAARTSSSQGADALTSAWADFIQELSDPVWHNYGVANVRFLESVENESFTLPTGVSIRGRSFDELLAMGFAEQTFSSLADDWGGGGSSKYVCLVERAVPKTPDNVVTSDGTLVVEALRLINALRLVGEGDITIGPMWFTRKSVFPIGAAGNIRAGWSVPAQLGGTRYRLTESLGADAAEVFANLTTLDEKGYGAGVGNLDLALRSFYGTYDRFPLYSDSQLVDAVTALEALLSTSDTEITFRLSLRVAALLGRDEQDRRQIFDGMKRFYDARSKHPGAPGSRNQHS